MALLFATRFFMRTQKTVESDILKAPGALRGADDSSPLCPSECVSHLDGEDIGGDELGDPLAMLVTNLLGFIGVEFRQESLQSGR